MAISNEDLWQRAWAETWQKSDVAGLAEDEKAVYARAQKVWRGWMAERDRIARERADAEGRRFRGAIGSARRGVPAWGICATQPGNPGQRRAAQGNPGQPGLVVVVRYWCRLVLWSCASVVLLLYRG